MEEGHKHTPEFWQHFAPFFTNIKAFIFGSKFTIEQNLDKTNPANICWSSRRLKDVLKTFLEDILNTCLEDVFKTCLKDVLKMSWKHLSKTSWRCFENVLKAYDQEEYIHFDQDVLKMSLRRLLKAKTKDVFRKYLSRQMFAGKFKLCDVG